MRLPNTKACRQRLISPQPEAIRAHLAAFFSRRPRRDRNRRVLGDEWIFLPYWRILPVALYASIKRSRTSGTLSRKLVKEVQWGQYCIFLFIRFQDDIFDGQSNDRVGVYAADQCLFEADRIFAKYFAPRSWFWKEYRKCLRLTTQSIVEVDVLQRSSDTKPEELLEGYARVSAILKVGSAAICALYGDKRAYRRISLFCDEMAKAGQILDDLRDLEEDMRRKRYNYVANVLRRSESEMPRRVRSDKLMNRLRVVAVAELIHEEVKAHVQTAGQIIAPLHIPQIQKYLSGFVERISVSL